MSDKWEPVCAGTARMPVQGGWLYKVQESVQLRDCVMHAFQSVVFVPAPHVYGSARDEWFIGNTQPCDADGIPLPKGPTP